MLKRFLRKTIIHATSTRLQRCPFCNSMHVELVERKKQFMVTCCICHASGAQLDSAELAVEAWNAWNDRRHTQTLPSRYAAAAYTLDQSPHYICPVVLTDAAMRVIEDACYAATTTGLETGGTLYGVAESNNSLQHIVRYAGGPPSDSIQTSARFARGMRGITETHILRVAAGDVYLGEWHYHPMGIPYPSEPDAKQIRDLTINRREDEAQPISMVVAFHRQVLTATVIYWMHNLGLMHLWPVD